MFRTMDHKIKEDISLNQIMKQLFGAKLRYNQFGELIFDGLELKTHCYCSLLMLKQTYSISCWFN